jgi:hypothetical protein
MLDAPTREQWLIFRQEHLNLLAVLEGKSQQLVDAKKAAVGADGDEDSPVKLRSAKKGFAPTAAGGDTMNPMKKAAAMRAARS